MCMKFLSKPSGFGDPNLENSVFMHKLFQLLPSAFQDEDVL